MATIVEYRDYVEPVNEYPARIVSPSRPSACCTRNMETVGHGQIEGLWRYIYKRCHRCGYTVRSFYALSWLALEKKWAGEGPDLAHWRVRLRRKQVLQASGQPLPARPRAARLQSPLPSRRAPRRPAEVTP